MPTQQLKYDTIRDFSPGIYSQTRGATPNVALPAPLGAAQVTNTFKCIALPSGGLAPLPAITATFNAPIQDLDASSLFGYFNIDGFFAFGPVGGGTPPDNLFFVAEYLRTAGGGGANRIATLYRMDLQAATVDSLENIVSTQLVTTEQYQAVQFGTTRMVNTPGPYTTPGNPVVVCSWAPPAFAADRHVWAFPDPANPSTSNAVDLATNQSGRVICHQGRVIVLKDLTNPFGGHAGDSVPTNEQINFSDPANSYQTTTTIGTQNQVFMLEYPNGYGTFGSISVGELFMVKHQGGGLRVSGDVANPTITRLAGVTSTGGLGCIGASTPIGFIYFTRFDGAWLWRGADTATKISSNLADDFMFYTPGPDKLVSFGVQVQAWGDWAVTTNGYLFDTNSQSWWRLDDPSTYTPQWFAPSFFAESLFVVPLRYNNTTKTGLIRQYSRQSPANSYSWQSHPIPESMDRIIDIRELVLLAQGSGTVTVSMTPIIGSVVTESFTVTNTTQPQRLRLPTECQGYNVVVRIVSTGGGGGAAPIVYSLTWGTREQIKAIAA